MRCFALLVASSSVPSPFSFVVVCGDGEYIIHTAISFRNKSFGQALEFVWAADSSEYAVRESSSKVKIFKNFKEKSSLKPDFSAEGERCLLARSTLLLLLALLLLLPLSLTLLCSSEGCSTPIVRYLWRHAAGGAGRRDPELLRLGQPHAGATH